MSSNYKGILVLIFFLVFFFFYYDIATILNHNIQGAHIWRQADCMAMVQNFKQFNLSFFQPASYNLQSTNGNVAGEFPLFYFIASKFEHSAFVLRLINFIVLSCSLIAIYFIAYFFIKKQRYALIITMLMCASPLLMYYGTNFLSDATAVSFLFISFSFYLYNYKNSINKYLAILFFILAVLMKASYVLFIIVPLYFYYRENKNTSHFKYIICILLILFLPILWYTYAKYYNHINHDSYYFLSIQPIWTMSFYDIGLSIWRVFKSNFYIFFLPVFSIATIIVFITSVIKNKKSIILKYTTIVFATTILYAILFLEKFIQHDYYYLFFMPFILMVLIQAVFWITNKVKNTKLIIIVFILVLIFNLYYCKKTISAMQTYSTVSSVLSSDEFQEFLLKNNCTSNKTVFCADDGSPNIYLYAIQRKGYTLYNVEHNQDISHYDFILTRDKNKLKKQNNTTVNYKGFYLVKKGVALQPY
ncbi:MAG: glycosyltransferase family 39 protein [Chitinophagales bacterium]|nr:glycosyltransferase family 39 protein [Chitinophagales bacterium]